MQAILPFPNISPEIFSFSLGGFEIALRWYALAYIAGLLLAWRWVVLLMKRPHLWKDDAPPMPAKQVEDLLTWTILGIILGGRLGFVTFYQPAYYLSHPLEIPAIWQGGMSFHGGFFGVIIAGSLFARKHGFSIAGLGDSFAVVVALGLFFGRIANFINAELWGRPSTAPWAVIFPGHYAQQCPKDWVGACARHPSQLYEAGLEGILLGIVMFILAHRRGWLKTPGALTGVFFLTYGASRSFVELFRQADAQFVTPDNQWGYVIQFGSNAGLTMGQTLSLPMVAFGAFLTWRARRVR